MIVAAEDLRTRQHRCSVSYARAIHARHSKDISKYGERDKARLPNNNENNDRKYHDIDRVIDKEVLPLSGGHSSYLR